MSSYGSLMDMFGQNTWSKTILGKKNHNELATRVHSQCVAHRWSLSSSMREADTEKREQSWSALLQKFELEPVEATRRQMFPTEGKHLHQTELSKLTLDW